MTGAGRWQALALAVHKRGAWKGGRRWHWRSSQKGSLEGLGGRRPVPRSESSPGVSTQGKAHLSLQSRTQRSGVCPCFRHRALRGLLPGLLLRQHILQHAAQQLRLCACLGQGLGGLLQGIFVASLSTRLCGTSQLGRPLSPAQN